MMAKYLIKYDMGFCGTDTDFCEIEIPDDEDPEGNVELQAALLEAQEAAFSNVSTWYERSDEE